ncbi:MAG: GTPase Era [Methylotenera sp. 24-45-7]|jgi:GTP-binding protein Era|nr:MAG: GTPase Era [Mehylophilales bacterium 35-46-6]OYZ41092.1 MAG: GTPase Era [Methylotenera sp. 24-45-7]OZA08961.1 MAG: GTPase Era [Methylotenera sp. 17-45-7]OZA54371.1 MAG: GTPase Era [Methylophilales bacterium 39-45-7]HQS36612.1 GTPase Era [Methylotenera sp.]
MTDQDSNTSTVFKCGTVAIVGRPNVGKSTLLNHILGMKLAITSRKAQTTRHRLLGIHTTEDTQFLFVDTPGFQQKHLNALNKGLNKTVTQVLSEVDAVLFVIEPMKLGDADRQVLKLLSEKTPTILVVNKLDLMGDKGNILPLIQDFDLEFPFADIVPVSAKKTLNIDELLKTIRKYLPEQPAIYGEDELTDKNERFLAAELLREKVFRFSGDEIPYSVAVEIEKFEVVGKLRRIFCAVIVDKESQKPMLIGKGGEKLKQISTEARMDMEKLFGGKVYLEVWVKVKGGWADDERALKSLGY